MTTAINQNLFRHREAASAGLNNLCTIVHQLKTEGAYLGEVIHGKRLLGVFRLRYERSHDVSQVNLDLSRFDEILRINTPGDFAVDYRLGGEGYVVFHATGHHDGLYVKVARTDVEKAGVTFDSRKLGPQDIVVFRLWHPGRYTIANVQGKQKASLEVTGAEDGKFRNPAKLEPARATLTEKGFEPERLVVAATQAMVISIQAPASLALTRDADEKSPEPKRPPKAAAPRARR